MRTVAGLLFLVPVLAGCLGADAGEDACGHCDEAATPTTVPLGDFTWVQPDGRAGRLYEEDIVSVATPNGIRRVLVEVTREHEGYEKRQAHLSVRVGDGQMGPAHAFSSASPLSADRESQDIGFGWRHEGGFQVRYSYEAQPEGVHHQLRFVVTGYA